RIAQGRWNNAGQTCTAPDYLRVLRDRRVLARILEVPLVRRLPAWLTAAGAGGGGPGQPGGGELGQGADGAAPPRPGGRARGGVVPGADCAGSAGRRRWCVPRSRRLRQDRDDGGPVTPLPAVKPPRSARVRGDRRAYPPEEVPACQRPP